MVQTFCVEAPKDKRKEVGRASLPGLASSLPWLHELPMFHSDGDGKLTLFDSFLPPHSHEALFVFHSFPLSVFPCCHHIAYSSCCNS